MQQLRQLMNEAIQNKSKIQQETYKLSQESLDELMTVMGEMGTKIPSTENCQTIKSPTPFVIDKYMKNMYDILTSPKRTGNISVYVVLIFTWMHSIGSFAIGKMNLLVTFRGKGHRLTRCIASKNNILMDEILPQNLDLVMNYVFTKDIMGANMDTILEKFRDFFDNESAMTETKLNQIVSLLDTKRYDRRIYMGLYIYTKHQDDGDVWVVRFNISYKRIAHHFLFQTPISNRKLIDMIQEKLIKRVKNPIQKLRSYAAKNNLPIFETTYYVSKEEITEFHELFSNVIWNNIGLLIFEMKKHWDSLPPYTGIYPVHLAVCQEEELFHMAVWIPYLKLMIDSYMNILDHEIQNFKKNFFPDERYKDTIRRYALNPSLPIKLQDSFLAPYVYNTRYNIITENVRIPSNKNVPSHLAPSIKQWRQFYKKKLQQHFQKDPQSISKFQLHESYKQDIVNALTEKQRQKAIEHYLYQEPLKQVPIDHVHRQEILKKRKQMKQQVEQFDSVEDIIESIWSDLNLVDPIRSTTIVNPVRSPYLQSGIYQQQSLRQWLGKGGLRLDPLTRKQMPRHFEPRVDQAVKNLIMELHEKIDTILGSDEDEAVKKLRLWLLKKDLDKRRVFQQIIKKNKQKSSVK